MTSCRARGSRWRRVGLQLCALAPGDGRVADAHTESDALPGCSDPCFQDLLRRMNFPPQGRPAAFGSPFLAFASDAIPFCKCAVAESTGLHGHKGEQPFRPPKPDWSCETSFADNWVFYPCTRPRSAHAGGSLAGNKGRIYHSVVSSVLTGCLTEGAHPIQSLVLDEAT